VSNGARMIWAAVFANYLGDQPSMDDVQNAAESATTAIDAIERMIAESAPVNDDAPDWLKRLADMLRPDVG